MSTPGPDAAAGICLLTDSCHLTFTSRLLVWAVLSLSASGALNQMIFDGSFLQQRPSRRFWCYMVITDTQGVDLLVVCVCVCGRENNRWAFVDRTFYIYFLILSSLVLLWAAVYECMTADCIFCVCLYVSLLYSENKSPSGTIKSKSNLNPPFGFKLKQEFCHHVWGSMPPNKLLFVTSCENIIY